VHWIASVDILLHFIQHVLQHLGLVNDRGYVHFVNFFVEFDHYVSLHCGEVVQFDAFVEFHFVFG
jgi:hypothetical protein